MQMIRGQQNRKDLGLDNGHGEVDLGGEVFWSRSVPGAHHICDAYAFISWH